jgi:carboxymethylenebutenolidase
MIEIARDDAIVQAYEALPEGNGPGVLLLHAWWGLTPVFQRACDRLAAAGFVAVAPDLFGGATATTIEAAERLVNTADSSAVELRARAAIDYLQSHGRVRGSGLGAVGFSFGAAWALMLSTHVSALRAVTVFYGAYAPDFSRSQAAYLGHFAPDDEWEPSENVQEMVDAMRAASRPATIHTYEGAQHWFMENDRPTHYHAASAELAWERTLAFLRTELASES